MVACKCSFESDEMLRTKSPRAGPPEKMLLGILAFLLLFYQYEGYRSDENRAKTSAYSERECLEAESGNCSNYSHTKLLWPNGTIPYIFTIDTNFSVPEEEKAKVREAMDWWENATCIQFIPTNSTSEPHLFVKLQYSSVRCSAYTGFRGRRVTTALITRTCLNGSNSVGNIAHEMGHVIGFNHEHNRPDRNSYITMHRGNILSYSAYMVDTDYDYLGTPYDLDSIMHYPPISGGDAVNPSLPVFTLKDDIVFNGTIGQRQCLSYYDIIATNQLYRCNRTTPPKTSCNFHERYMMPTNQSGSGATPQPLNTTTETSSNNSNFIYPGDTVAFKSTLSSSQRWIGCTDESMCFAWGCPGRAFALINQSRCWEFQFVVSPVRVISTATTPLRFGNRVVLQQCRSFTSSTANCTSFVPLSCPGDGEQCSFVDEECCGSDSWRHTAAGPRCQHSIFRLVSPDGGTHILEHRHRVMLVDDSSTSAHQSLCCYVRNERKRKKTCQLQPYNVCNGPEHHFQIFKL